MDDALTPDEREALNKILDAANFGLRPIPQRVADAIWIAAKNYAAPVPHWTKDQLEQIDREAGELLAKGHELPKAAAAPVPAREQQLHSALRSVAIIPAINPFRCALCGADWGYDDIVEFHVGDCLAALPPPAADKP